MNIESDNDRLSGHHSGRTDYGVETGKTTSRRVPVIAALMSAALPGFGQLYNGWLVCIGFFVVHWGGVAVDD